MQTITLSCHPRIYWEDLYNKIKHDLAKVFDWFEANKLSLNVRTTNNMLFYKPLETIEQNVFGRDNIENVRISGVYIGNIPEIETHLLTAAKPRSSVSYNEYFQSYYIYL
jgi:hypothetical protein